MKNFKKIIDISLPIYPGMIRYPKNPLVRFKRIRSGGQHPSELTEIKLGTHTGTHVDAPRHVFKNKKTLDKLPISLFVGPCRVLDMTNVREVIKVVDLRPKKIKKGERILFQTRNSSRGYKKFRRDFIALDGPAADFLAKKGIILVGTDYLSIKKSGDKDHRAHSSLLANNIVIFEGLNLSDVKEGRYFFVGLPLKLISTDGAPARALLLQ